MSHDPNAFHRPPRDWPAPVPTEPVRVAPPPTAQAPPQSGLLQTLFPVVGGVGLVGYALVFGSSKFLIIAGVMIVLLLGFSVGMRWSQKRGVRKRAAEDARKYGRHLRERETELAEAGDRQRAALARLYPDPGRLWTAMVKREGTWERRPDHHDFLHVRLGRGTVALDRPVELDLGMNPLTEYQPHPLHEARKLVERRGRLRNEPVVVDLADVGVLAITGDRRRARGTARALMVQLAAWRAPHDVRLVSAFEGPDAAEWEWGKWLPHQRLEQPSGPAGEPRLPVLTLASSPAELDALLEAELRPRLEQLRRVAESGLAGQERPLVAHELVVVVDGYSPRHPANDLPAFRELLARAREVKALLVLLVDEREREPAQVDARLVVPERGTASWERTGPNAPRIDELFLDEVDVGTSEALARALTPLRLEEGGDGERGLQADLHLVDVLGLASAAELDPARSQAPRSRSRQLRVPIGVQADGELLELDLKQAAEGGMGPHGILVGATGSGKSELLRSLVAGLAATHDTDALAFVLVDFKGGAAFVELARLPHVAGLITNLQSDLALVDRMHDALSGEVERRQRLLRDAGNVDDVVSYRARRRAHAGAARGSGDPGLPPLPDLLVIVDEFAELLAARPEFIDLFVSLGRVGRSLGMHLLLSSQRLDEGRLRGLESHLRYRMCLRTYSATESKVVLGTPDAYLLPSTPGLGYLKVDTEVYSQFRAALSTSPFTGDAAQPAAEPPPEVLAFDAGWSPAAAAAGAAEPARAAADRTDLDVLIDRLVGGRGDAAPVHQVWVPPLPAALPLDAVSDEAPWWTADGPSEDLGAVIGRVDRPAEQRTEPLRLDLAGAGGHAVVVGAPRTGKSTLLRTLVAALVRRHTPDEVRVYALDLGGGSLGALARAPHVGGVAGKLEREAVQRVVRQLRTELEEREEAFRRLGIESMAEARRRRAAGELGEAGPIPDLVLVVDGWATFHADFDELDREVEALAAGGLAFGVHVVVAANRWADMRQALVDNLGTRLELRLNDPLESLVSRTAASSLPADVPGRGLTPEGLHFQGALPRADGVADDAGLADALGALLDEANARWPGADAEPIRLLPRELSPAELPAPVGSALPIGVDERKLEPVWLDLETGDPHLLVFGDAEAGKTSLLRLLAQGLAARSPDEVRLVVVDVRRSLADLASLPQLAAYATTPPAVATALGDLAALVGERMPEDPVAAPEPWSGPQTYLLFDDYDLVAGPTSNPLTPLLDLLALGRDVGLHVVLARRVGGSARGAYEPGFQRVRELGSPGLLLGGDPGEGPLLGGVRAEPQPSGRGLLVRPGRRPLLVQTAHAPADGPLAAPLAGRAPIVASGGGS